MPIITGRDIIRLFLRTAQEDFAVRVKEAATKAFVMDVILTG